jgi:ATP-dependent protease HslVU (ClpYQ) peptidase subunit
MTTIVYRDGVMAGDGRSTAAGWIKTENTKKVIRLSTGALLGFAGTLAMLRPIAAALEKGHEPPALAESGSAMLVTPDGKVTIYEDSGYFDVSDRPFFALGTGMSAAYGALHMGATAEQAVEIACRLDSESGGVIQVERLRGFAEIAPKRLQRLEIA